MSGAQQPLPVQQQVSAGGVVYRGAADQLEVALIRTHEGRWQLPKGLVGADELPEAAALREVLEETGLEAVYVASLDTVEYWYVGYARGQKVRFHKFVHFYLLACHGGDTRRHDREVAEARFVPLHDARALLAFKGERGVLDQAEATLSGLTGR